MAPLDLPGVVYAVGFSPWKRSILAGFLRGRRIRQVAHLAAVPDGATAIVWGRRPAESGDGRRDIVSVEDGFLRSVGLGAAFVRPLSWVFDRRGIYFDPGTPSDLEVLLQEWTADPELEARAARLRGRIVAGGFTKYNLSGRAWTRPRTDRRVILVPGQVEADASVKHGGAGIKSNLDLLRAVRAAAPDAYLIYKPHPDVVAGLREGRADGRDEASLYDECVIDVGMDVLLESVDEVHVLTSLTGFEALLRGRRVATYGQPFYAGWGLTQDRCPPVRRTRRLMLDQLVAAALFAYPSYVDHDRGASITPEQALDLLDAQRRRSSQLSAVQMLAGRLLQRCRTWRARVRAFAA